MSNLRKYDLETEPARVWVCDQLTEINSLSTLLLKTVDFSLGSFFTLLPEGSNLDQLYKFEEGLILPNQNQYTFQDNAGTYAIIPTIDDELATILYNLLKSNDSLSCIFDDVTRLPSDKPVSDLYKNCGKTYKNECYYIIDNHCIEKSLIKKCLLFSSSGWHSLCILTAFKHLSSLANLSITHLKSICSNAQLVILGAYDLEGYIFWKRKSDTMISIEKIF